MPKKRTAAITRDGSGPELDLKSLGRKGPVAQAHFNPASPESMAALQRTLNYETEVMVKVTGGGRDTGTAPRRYPVKKIKGPSWSIILSYPCHKARPPKPCLPQPRPLPGKTLLKTTATPWSYTTRPPIPSMRKPNPKKTACAPGR